MPLVLPFPDIDPVLVSFRLFGLELAIRWYALAYIAGLLLGWRYVVWLCRRPALWGGTAPMRPEQADDLLTWMILGVILGGRLGYVLFYQPAYFAAHPGRDPRGLAGRHVVPRRPARRRRRHRRLLPAQRPARSCRSATRWRRPRRSGCSSGASPTSSTPSSGAGPRPRPGRWSSPARRRRPARRAGSGPAPGTRRSSTRPGSRGSLLFVLLALAIRAGALRRPGRVFGLFLIGYGLARIVVEGFRQADAQFVTAGNPHGHVLRLGAELGPDHGPAPVAADARRRPRPAPARGAEPAGVTPLGDADRASGSPPRGRSASTPTWRSASATPSTATTGAATRSAPPATS